MSRKRATSPRPFIAVNLDAALMGVGGDDSWTACVHDEFLITPPVAEPFEWEITLQPEEDDGDEAPAAGGLGGAGGTHGCSPSPPPAAAAPAGASR